MAKKRAIDTEYLFSLIGAAFLVVVWGSLAIGIAAWAVRFALSTVGLI